MGDIIFGGGIIELNGRFRNPVPFMKRVGVMMKSRAAATFKDQGRGGIAWKPRAVPNVIGIIKDAEAGRKTIPKRRFEARPAGIDTRFLARSISYEVRGQDTVAIGTTTQYASKVQTGGVSTVRINMIARKNLTELIGRARAKVAKGKGNPQDKMLAQLGWLLFASQVKKNVPPRPFIFFSEQDETDIFSMARDYFGKPGSAAQAKP